MQSEAAMCMNPAGPVNCAMALASEHLRQRARRIMLADELDGFYSRAEYTT